ncbi:hypothetical protein LOZ61_006778 [Ophidiomyces ophidiicola]|nr:hypothetical protein LOZ61_006778 [Ophidiomyces ophidiicola]
MDNTIKPEDYETVLRKFDRRKEHDKFTNNNDASRQVAASIGAETPLVVLTDIRSLLSDISNKLDTSNELLSDSLKDNRNYRAEDVAMREEHHKATLAYMQQLSDSISSGSRGESLPLSYRSPASATKSSVKDSYYYYRGHEIKNSEAVIGCILMHLDILVSNSTDQHDSLDASIMELPQWRSAVSVIKSADKNLKFVKMSSFETSQALDIIASPVPGRPVTIQANHITELSNSCATIIGHVELIRNRLLQCPGIISINRARHLAALNFPYVTMEGILNLKTTIPRIAGSNAVIDTVRSLNDTQKKAYAAKVLNEQLKPIVASMHAKNT